MLVAIRVHFAQDFDGLQTFFLAWQAIWNFRCNLQNSGLHWRQDFTALRPVVGRRPESSSGVENSRLRFNAIQNPLLFDRGSLVFFQIVSC